MGKTKKFSVEGEIDVTKVKRGHRQHKSGVGIHRDRRRKTRQKQREEFFKQGE